MQHMNITAGNELNETEQKYMASLQEVIINNKLKEAERSGKKREEA